ncbi:MAG TPA: glycosyltransferase [Longimicrobium sp.]|nr:glycosyltransferase [Longimicrobium sp.]
MKLLVVTHEYAPALNPRAFRWTAVAETLAARGHQVDVVAHGVPGAPRREVRAGVSVHRVGGGLGEGLRRRLTQAPSAGSGAAPAPSGGARALARRVHDRVWKRLYWPDYACLWYPAAVRHARALLHRGGYDRLISVSHPFTGHWVGAALKEERPDLPWLVDVGDPFAFIQGTPVNNVRLYDSLNYRAERRVLRAASVVSVTTGPTRVRYAQAFPEVAGKLVVVPPLLSPSEPRREDGRFLPEGPGRVRMVFVGTLYRDLRNPGRLLHLFRALLNTEAGAGLELHFVGMLNGCEAMLAPYAGLIGDRIFCHGAVSRERALRAMHEADVLVNLGNRSGYQLPSKVVEYVATGRPVLNLPGAPDDASVQFFSGYPAALQLGHQEPDDADAVARVAAWLACGRGADAAAVERCLAPYRPDAIVDQYERLLQCAS